MTENLISWLKCTINSLFHTLYMSQTKNWYFTSHYIVKNAFWITLYIHSHIKCSCIMYTLYIEKCKHYTHSTHHNILYCIVFLLWQLHKYIINLHSHIKCSCITYTLYIEKWKHYTHSTHHNILYCIIFCCGNCTNT